MKNVAVFFGGKSAEHDISCITGAITLNALKKGSYNPVPIFIDYDDSWWTGESLFDIENHKNPDYRKLKRVCLLSGGKTLYRIKGNKLKPHAELFAAVNALHGEFGEDGSLAGFLQLCDIAFVGSPVLGSSVSMNKSAAKIFLRGLGVNVLPCETTESEKNLERISEKIGFPLIVKPQCGGSSIGISGAENLKELERATLTALRYGEKAVIERKIKKFTEINVAVYKNSENQTITSECERPIAAKDVLSFDDKYKNGVKEFPAKIPKKISDEIKRISAFCYDALELEGIVRMDFMLEKDNIYLNEINTVPGSLAYYLFCDTAKQFCALIEELISRADRKYAKREAVKRRFVSGVLDLKGIKGAKRLK